MLTINRFVLIVKGCAEGPKYGSHRGQDAEPAADSFVYNFDAHCYLQISEVADLYREALKQGWGSITVYPIVLGEPLSAAAIKDLRKKILVVDKGLCEEDLALLRD